MALSRRVRAGDISVSKAKKAISDYKKAIGQPEGVAELMVFYCEQAADFSDEFGLQDDGYFSALVRMFEQALKFASTTPGRHWSRGSIEYAALVIILAMASEMTWISSSRGTVSARTTPSGLSRLVFPATSGRGG